MTHGLHWLPKVDTILVLVGGRISEQGSYEDLLSVNGDFAAFLKQYLLKRDELEDDDDNSDPESSPNPHYITHALHKPHYIPPNT